jgi:hypothetical protein
MAAPRPLQQRRQDGGAGRGHPREPQEQERRARHERHVEAGDREDVVDTGLPEIRQQRGRQLAPLPDEETFEERPRDRRQMRLDHPVDPEPGPEPPGQWDLRQTLHALGPRGQEVARGPRPVASGRGARVAEWLQTPDLARDADVITGRQAREPAVDGERQHACSRGRRIGAVRPQDEREPRPEAVDLGDAADEPVEDRRARGDAAERRERVR